MRYDFLSGVEETLHVHNTQCGIYPSVVDVVKQSTYIQNDLSKMCISGQGGYVLMAVHI